jgi:hypothetical protein
VKTFVFQLEVEMADDEDVQRAVHQALRAAADNLRELRKPGEDPPFRLTVIPLGLKPPC